MSDAYAETRYVDSVQSDSKVDQTGAVTDPPGRNDREKY
jgi:hypothetical protein